MTGGLNEQVSALVDGELREEEAELLLRQLAHSKELKARFARYCLISEALHRNLSVATGSDLTDRVARALEDEPSYGGSQRQKPQKRQEWRGGAFLRPAAGMAFAVTGALAMVALWPQQNQDTASAQATRPAVAVQQAVARSSQPIQAVDSSEPSAPSIAVNTTGGQRQWEHLDPQVRQQLTDYLVKHSERSASGQMDTALPYMRIIGYETGE